MVILEYSLKCMRICICYCTCKPKGTSLNANRSPKQTNNLKSRRAKVVLFKYFGRLLKRQTGTQPCGISHQRTHCERLSPKWHLMRACCRCSTPSRLPGARTTRPCAETSLGAANACETIKNTRMTFSCQRLHMFQYFAYPTI